MYVLIYSILCTFVIVSIKQLFVFISYIIICSFSLVNEKHYFRCPMFNFTLGS